MSDDIKKTQQIGHGIATPANGTGIPEAYVHKGYQFKESGRAPLPGGEKFFEIKHPEGHKEEVIARDHAAVGKMIDQIHRKKHMEKSQKCLKCQQMHNLKKNCWERYDVRKSEDLEKATLDMEGMDNKEPDAANGFYAEMKRRSAAMDEMDTKYNRNEKCMKCSQDHDLTKRCFEKSELEKGRIKDAVVGAATAAAIATTGASMVHDQVHATKFAMDSQAKAKKIAAPAAPKSAEQANEKPGRSWNQLKKEEMEKGLKQDLTAGLALGASVIAVHGAQTSHSGAQAAQVATQTGQRMTQETIEPVKNEHIDAASPDRKLANMRDRLSTIRQNINKPKPPKK